MEGEYDFKISAEMGNLAEQALALPPIKTTERYSIHPLPEGFMDHFVLWLWQEGQDFPADRAPEGFEMPVIVDGRRGYLMEKSRAEKYKE